MSLDYLTLKWIFKESKKRKGWIYLMKYTHPEIVEVNREDGTKSPYCKWKYGKTKDLEKRLKFYSKDYELIEAWRVNHLSLRENFIHQDWDIANSRDENMQDYKDEHVMFDCYDIVKAYATGEVTIEEDKNEWGVARRSTVWIEGGGTGRDLHSSMFNLLKII